MSQGAGIVQPLYARPRSLCLRAGGRWCLARVCGTEGLWNCLWCLEVSPTGSRRGSLPTFRACLNSRQFTASAEARWAALCDLRLNCGVLFCCVWVKQNVRGVLIFLLCSVLATDCDADSHIELLSFGRFACWSRIMVVSLLELCVRSALDNLQYLGDVGETDIQLLKRILPHCNAEQLNHIESSSTVRFCRNMLVS